MVKRVLVVVFSILALTAFCAAAPAVTLHAQGSTVQKKPVKTAVKKPITRSVKKRSTPRRKSATHKKAVAAKPQAKQKPVVAVSSNHPQAKKKVSTATKSGELTKTTRKRLSTKPR
jgi:hypothetical protein